MRCPSTDQPGAGGKRAEHDRSQFIGTHGRSGFKRFLMGSVTENVMNTTHLPLLVIQPQEQAARVNA
jgi:hypothetical protein